MTEAPSSRPLRIVFAGTPDTALPALEAVAASRHELVGVLTRTDARRGRSATRAPSPVAAVADRLGAATVKSDAPDAATAARVAAWRPDLGVVVAYGALLREPLLSMPAHGWVNLHFSALPRWRGAAPVQRAILAGDDEIGLDVFRLVAALDAGDVIASDRHRLAGDETAGEALATLAVAGARLLVSAIDAIADGTAEPRPQHGPASHAAKLTNDDARIRWEEPAASVYARIRAVTPEPGAHTMLGETRLKIHRARPAAPESAALAPGRLAAAPGGVLVGTATSPLLLETVQPAGKRAMPAADWWRGHAADDAVLR